MRLVSVFAVACGAVAGPASACIIDPPPPQCSVFGYPQECPKRKCAGEPIEPSFTCSSSTHSNIACEGYPWDLSGNTLTYEWQATRPNGTTQTFSGPSFEMSCLQGQTIDVQLTVTWTSTEQTETVSDSYFCGDIY